MSQKASAQGPNRIQPSHSQEREELKIIPYHQGCWAKSGSCDGDGAMRNFQSVCRMNRRLVLKSSLKPIRNFPATLENHVKGAKPKYDSTAEAQEHSKVHLYTLVQRTRRVRGEIFNFYFTTAVLSVGKSAARVAVPDKAIKYFRLIVGRIYLPICVISDRLK